MTSTTKNSKRVELVSIISELILILNEKETRTITGRFGLNGRKETLSKVGSEFGLSRERVRQIEKNALIKMAKIFNKDQKIAIEKIVEIFEKNGGVITDENIPESLQNLANSKFARNYLRLVFTLMSEIVKINENADINNGWMLKKEKVENVLSVCDKIIKNFKKTELSSTVSDIQAEVAGLSKFEINFLHSCISICPKLTFAKNGMVGLTSWPTVNPRNVRDKIYYVLKDNEKPMHFSEISKQIAVFKFDNKKVVPATVHNELIADKRFVLIGRGIYALREWGYSDGTVYEVIKNILSNSKNPISVNEIVAMVTKSRKVKKNTIVINLQTKKEFKKVAGGYVFAKLSK